MFYNFNNFFSFLASFFSKKPPALRLFPLSNVEVVTLFNCAGYALIITRLHFILDIMELETYSYSDKLFIVIS